MNYVLYHANCPDGFLAAFTCWLALNEPTEYIPCSYGKDPGLDQIENSIVYMVDFSFPREEIIRLAKRNKRVFVFDHHKTAEENLKNLNKELSNVQIVFDQSRCGSMITYNQLIGINQAPPIYHYVQDRDLWQWKLRNSREVNAALSIKPQDFEYYKEYLLQAHPDDLAQEGEIVIKVNNQKIEKILNNAFFTKVGDYIIPVINSPVLQSELGEALNLKYTDYPFSGVYYTIDFTDYWSLRSKGDFDVSEVGRQYGGGGHKNAAGFKVIN
jgi:uncharacterized protein